MKLWFAVFLGLIQGITEFLPVSSSGHLSILQNMFGMTDIEKNHMLFDVLLHLGTLIAVCLAYHKDIRDILRELGRIIGGKAARQGEMAKSRSAARLIMLLVISTLPLFIAVLFKKYVEKLYYNTIFIGAALIVTGVLLFIADRVPRGKKNEKNATLSNALTVGIMQAIAVVPGLSRSGTTITTGLLLGFDREFAVKFSFLMSIPAVLGANILSLAEAVSEGVNISLLPIYLAGVIAAAVSGFFAIKLVRYIAKTDRFGIFAYYCWVAGIVAIILTIIV